MPVGNFNLYVVSLIFLVTIKGPTFLAWNFLKPAHLSLDPSIITLSPSCICLYLGLHLLFAKCFILSCAHSRFFLIVLWSSVMSIIVSSGFVMLFHCISRSCPNIALLGLILILVCHRSLYVYWTIGSHVLHSSGFLSVYMHSISSSV